MNRVLITECSNLYLLSIYVVKIELLFSPKQYIEVEAGFILDSPAPFY